MRPTKFSGRVWVIKDENGNWINNIDTDMIYHNAHLAITDIKEMSKYAFGNLKGWNDFAKKVQESDIIIAGKNFGCGSSRQQAVDCFISLGISLLICESFGAIYKRNAINSALPILSFPYLTDIGVELFKNNDIIEVELDTGKIVNKTSGKEIKGASPLSKVQMDIYQAGGLFKFGCNTRFIS